MEHMELTTANAWKIYGLGPSGLKTYLPRIFERLKVPVADGIWVETYVEQLNRKLKQSLDGSRPLSGWDGVMKVCVETSVFETMFSLVQHPRGDMETAVVSAIDCLHNLVMKANRAERRDLLERAVGCNALDVCMRILRHHELCLHRYSAGRMLRTLCADLGYGTKMTPAVTGAIIESLCRYVLDERESYSVELSDPDKAWQAYRMTQHAAYTPEMASKYGKRWFGLTQELCLWAVHDLIICEPPLTRKHIFEIVQSRPLMLDLLLDIASLPRPVFYPETTADQIATETLAMMLQLPLHAVPGLEIPLEGELKEALNAEWQATVSTADLFTERPSWLQKLLDIWKRLDKERLPELRHLLDRVHSDWYGVEPDLDAMAGLYEYRGHMRLDILSITTTLTFVPDIDNTDLISLLRLAYESTKKAAPISREADLSYDCKEEELYERYEWTVSIFRIPMGLVEIGEPGVTTDAVGDIPAAAVSAPIALLRLLTVLAQRGVLNKASTWRSLPDGVAEGTHFVHVQQILSDMVIGKTLSVIAKRVTTQREKSKKNVKEAPYTARSEYRQAAQLAAGLVGFDEATRGHWNSSIIGMRKELVLCLGNAAEMSNRLHDYEAALGFSLAAQDVALKASRNEGITSDIIAKNTRRLEVAQDNLK